MEYEKKEWLIWTQEAQEWPLTQEIDLSQVKVQEWIRSKSRTWNSSPHSFPHNGLWLSEIGDSSSRMTGMGIKTDSKILLKSGSKTRVNIDSEI